MKAKPSLKKLQEIWHQVPPDYYQKGVEENVFQKFWHNQKLKSVMSFIEMSKSPKSIIDVGCASGWFLSEVAKRHPEAKCVGIDIYKDAISYGKKTYPSIRFVKADAHVVPLTDKFFDAIICTEVLEHVVEPKKVLLEIKRLLSDDGNVIIEMDTGNLLFRTVWYFWTTLRRGVWRDSHIHAFNTDKLEDMIIQSGFIIERKKVFNYSMAISFLCRKKL